MVAATALVALLASASAVNSWRTADRSTARLEATEARLADLEERVVAQSLDLAAATTSLRLLQRDMRSVAATLEEAPDVPAVTRRVLASVFTVETEDGSGSAFVIATADGSSRLVTNAHVVSSVWNNGGRGVRLLKGDQVHAATITAMSFQHDLAVLTVGVNLPALERAEARASAGDPVLVIGSPLGLEGTVSSGVVSSYRTEEGAEHLQISAPTNPGNSGGPVTDTEGRVLGVLVAKYVGFGIEALSFAVPIDRVCQTFDVC